MPSNDIHSMLANERPHTSGECSRCHQHPVGLWHGRCFNCWQRLAVRTEQREREIKADLELEIARHLAAMC